MNKKIHIPLAITALIFLSSCLTSLHRLVTYTTITTDDRITGNWQYDNLPVKLESLPNSSFFKNLVASTVNKEEKKSGYGSTEDSLLYSRSYVISFVQNGYQYYMICCLIRLANDTYADIEPAATALVNKPTEKDMDTFFNGGSYISSHTIAKVIFHGNEIELRFLDGEFVRKQLKDGRVAIKYEDEELFNTMLITSSSADLRQFLVKYGNDERLYNKENTITLKKI